MRVIVVFALLVVACTAAPAGSVAPTTSPPAATPSPRPPTAPPPAPTATRAQATASPAAGLLDLCDPADRGGCELAPGTYSPSLTTPKMTFTLGEGWTGVRHYADGFSLVNDNGGAILSFARDVTVGGVELNQPGGFQALMESVSALGLRDVGATEIGGRPALVLDFTAVDEAPGFIALDEDHYNLSQGQSARFIVLDIEGVVGMFIVESGSEDTFQEAIAAAQPVLDSVAFE